MAQAEAIRRHHGGFAEREKGRNGEQNGECYQLG
jgi:hypothetical protein